MTGDGFSAVAAGDLRRARRALESSGDTWPSDDGLDALADLIARYGADRDLAVRETVAEALLIRAEACEWLGRFEDALGSWDELIVRYREVAISPARAKLAEALLGKAISLRLLGRIDAKLSVLDSVIAEYDADVDPEVRRTVAQAVHNKRDALGIVGRHADADIAHQRLITDFRGLVSPDQYEYPMDPGAH